MDLKSRDNRLSTPLHWACYSKSEIAMCYLLAWVNDLEDQDCDGFTPLHLAIKSVAELGSTRPVRTLLVRGASREARSKDQRTPADLITHIPDPFLKNELKVMLKEPKVCSCFMVKTPLKLLRKSA